MIQPDDTNQSEGFEPLHKVLPAGGPILSAGQCPKCHLPAGAGQPGNCPAAECDIGSCPLRSAT